MEDKQFTFKTLLEHAVAYGRALLKQQLYKAGDTASKALHYAVLVAIFCVLGPVLLTMLFVALGFGFQSWLPNIGYGMGFLLSAASVLLIGLLLIWIGKAYVRKVKAWIFVAIINAADKLDEASLKTKAETARGPEEELFVETKEELEENK